jgi:phage terminase Nu1 subunit (DNA packaging protein)
MTGPLTLNAYARHRRSKRLPGGSIRAVVEAVAAGRIDVAPGQMILDPAEADAQWEARTDASKRHVASSNGHSLADARRLESLERARGLKLANDLRAGRLVERAAIERHWAQYIITCRDRLLGIPSKLRSRFPHLSAGDLAGIDEVIRECLTELSEGRRDDGTLGQHGESE